MTLRVSALVGVIYFAIGLVFATLAAGSHHVAWRLTAWALSGVVFVAHIGYERRRLGRSARSAALGPAVAVALGSLGLAVTASLRSPHANVLAYAVWPLVTGLPAFLVAWGVGGPLRPNAWGRGANGVRRPSCAANLRHSK